MFRLSLALLGSVLAVLAAPVSAGAAYFTAQPPTYVQSGAGPFEWRFLSSTPGSSTGKMAYKLSTESVWHRCAKDYPPRLSDLPEGAYSVTIADDIDLDWYSARGLLFSGFTQPCFDSPTTAAPLTLPTTAMLYVDSTGPTVSEPSVITAGLDSLVSVQTSDAVAGIASIEWSAGDGYMDSGHSYIRHSYLAAGTWHGSVTVTDRAGNQTVRSYTVTAAVSAPPASSPSVPALSPADTTAPSLRLHARARQLLRRSGAAVVSARCSETCTVTASAKLTVSAHRYTLRSVRVPLAVGQTRTLRLKLTAGQRATLTRAARHHKRATATIRVTATDAAGNHSTKTTRVRAV